MLRASLDFAMGVDVSSELRVVAMLSSSRLSVPVVLSVLCIFAACGGEAPPPTCKTDEIVNLDLESSKRLNGDTEGDSRSTVVRIYQLTDAAGLSAAGFDALWSNDARAVLGESLLGADQISALPGERTSRKLIRNPKTQYVGIAGQFRQEDASGLWRAIIRLPPRIDPCALSSDRARAPLPPLWVNVYLQDYVIRAQTNFYMPSAPAGSLGPATAVQTSPTGAAPNPAGAVVESWTTPDVSSNPSPSSDRQRTGNQR
jgi:type VI secretion system VasD/TssJ family lipoprotein